MTARHLASVLIFLMVPSVALAQSRVYRIAYLSSQSVAGGQPQFDASRLGLRDSGYVEGRNIFIEPRWADGDYARLPKLAIELVRPTPDLIVSAGGPPTARAVKAATTTIPVVFISGHAVEAGIVSSLARPGGNLTGFEVFAEELDVKRLELLKKTFPKAERVVVLWNPTREGQAQRRRLESAAPALGLKVRFIGVRNPGEIASALAATARERADAMLLSADPMFVGEARRIIELTAAGRRPAIYPVRTFPEGGGLMSYGADFDAIYRRAATYVEKDPQGRQARRSPGGTADQVRAGDQPQDRQGARRDDSARRPAPRRPGDRVTRPRLIAR
jgi:putative ABC transport system substrate-binding protein